ncbi:hypothetical protein AB0I54_08595 [Streptomyces sp. NPDC050625]|uniref:hypothetical protein n=1 Tax=Streptomyces sp. NPDC050625 TaxID=3154629 RepID=UPI003433C134
MTPTNADQPQRPKTFKGVLRFVVRRPVLVAWLVALAVLPVVFQDHVPDPWSGLIYLVITPISVWSIEASLERAYPHDNG